MNIHPNLNEIPPLTADNAQCQHVNLTQATSGHVQCQLEDDPRSVGCKSCPVNNGFEAARIDYRLRCWPFLGKHSPGKKHFNQFCVTEKCVRCGLMLNYWSKGGVHGKASRTSSLSSHVGRSKSQTSRVANRTDEDGVRGSVEDSEVSQIRTDVSDSRVGRRVFPSTWSGKESSPENETRGHVGLVE